MLVFQSALVYIVAVSEWEVVYYNGQLMFSNADLRRLQYFVRPSTEIENYSIVDGTVSIVLYNLTCSNKADTVLKALKDINIILINIKVPILKKKCLLCDAKTILIIDPPVEWTYYQTKVHRPYV